MQLEHDVAEATIHFGVLIGMRLEGSCELQASANENDGVGNLLTGRERVLAVLAGEEVDRIALMPITMMFAADILEVKY
jgi:hypothetical protein